MRSSFRKEQKKIKDSKTSGSGAQDVYVPKLFYFEDMLFLQDQDIPRPAVSNMQMTEPSQDVMPEGEINEDTQCSVDLQCESTGPDSPVASSSVIRPRSPQFQGQQQTRETTKKIKKKAQEEDLLAIACNTLKNSSNTDKYDIFGQHVASTIRDMSWEQQIYAEKIISEVLFEGRLSTLSRNTRLQADSILAFPQAVVASNYTNYSDQRRPSSSLASTSAYPTETQEEMQSYRSYECNFGT